ncbi:MAG: hypothetical protein QM391_02960 [Bacillota bacterium]|nr:hypothetical protein [Bacillota bacterium]HPZ93127.1 hypothetical protein [Bacillota bacterium]
MLFLLPGMLVRLAKRAAWSLGIMPQSSYVHEVMQALKRDGLDEAIKLYHLSIRRRQPSNITEVARELIEQHIDVRIGKLQNRINEIEAQLAARKTLRARLQCGWRRITSFFIRGKPFPETDDENELQAELAEHKAMIEGLWRIKARLRAAEAGRAGVS